MIQSVLLENGHRRLWITPEILTVPHQCRAENFDRTQTYRGNVSGNETPTCAQNAAELLPLLLFGKHYVYGRKLGALFTHALGAILSIYLKNSVANFF